MRMKNISPELRRSFPGLGLPEEIRDYGRLADSTLHGEFVNAFDALIPLEGGRGRTIGTRNLRDTKIELAIDRDASSLGMGGPPGYNATRERSLLIKTPIVGELKGLNLTQSLRFSTLEEYEVDHHITGDTWGNEISATATVEAVAIPPILIAVGGTKVATRLKPEEFEIDLMDVDLLERVDANRAFGFGIEVMKAMATNLDAPVLDLGAGQNPAS